MELATVHSISVAMFPAMSLSRRVSEHKQEVQGKGRANYIVGIELRPSLPSHSVSLTGMSTSAPTVTGTSTSGPLTGTSTSAPLTGTSTSAPLTGMSTSAHPTGGALISASLVP